MPIPSNVDFIVIGAQKAGTTSLFHYLRAHPQIHMPFVKEVGFFSSERRFRKGTPWYLKQFAQASQIQIVGEVSPQYMMQPEIPKRIHDLFPDTKLIAVLRNPIDRAYSAYRMAYRLGAEKRTAHEALQNFPTPDLNQPLKTIDFIGMGLYGKILEKYLKHFPIEQIKLVFTEELADQPGQTLQNLFNFLEVNRSFQPQNIQRQYHRGGEQKYSFLQPVKWLIGKFEKLLPAQHRGWSFHFDQWNTRPLQGTGLTPELRSRLVAYYKVDIARLEQLFQVQVPWDEFRSSGKP